jgi:hypothetical protein
MKDTYKKQVERQENQLILYPKEKALMYIFLSDHKLLLTNVMYYHNLEAKTIE